jgi:hypothetical protein
VNQTGVSQWSLLGSQAAWQCSEHYDMQYTKALFYGIVVLLQKWTLIKKVQIKMTFPLEKKIKKWK